MPHRLLKEAPDRGCITLGGQQEGPSGLPVDRPIPILPGAVDLDVYLIPPPAGTNGMLVLAEDLFQQWQNWIARRLIDEWSAITSRACIISSTVWACAMQPLFWRRSIPAWHDEHEESARQAKQGIA
jgi:hypothetical protein